MIPVVMTYTVTRIVLKRDGETRVKTGGQQKDRSFPVMTPVLGR
jgi:hypothetical protein